MMWFIVFITYNIPVGTYTVTPRRVIIFHRSAAAAASVGGAMILHVSDYGRGNDLY